MNLLVYKNEALITQIDLSLEAGSSDNLSLSIGRSEDSFIYLKEGNVSRHHASLTYKDGKWSIKKEAEFGSVLLNNKEINEEIIEHSCNISIGGFLLSFVSDEDLKNTESDNIETKQVSNSENKSLLGESDETEVIESNLENSSTEETIEDENNFSESDHYENDFTDGDDSNSEFDEHSEDNFDDNDNDSENDGDFEMVYDDNNDESSDKTEVLQLFSKVELILNGEYAPFEEFMLKDDDTYFGRDPEKCQIILNDPEVSSVHAVLRKKGLLIELEDQDSSNGTMLNGKLIKNQSISNGDEFIIGSTTFSCKITSSFLKDEKDRLMPVEANQSIEVEEIVEVNQDDFSDDDGEDGAAGDGSGSFLQSLKNDPAKRKKLLIYAVVLLALWIVLDDEKPKKKIKNTKNAKKSSRLLGDQKKSADKQKYLKKLNPKQLKIVETSYLIANSLFKSGKYDETMRELDKIFVMIEDYKKARQIFALSKEAMKKLEELAKKEKIEKERKAKALKIKNLLAKATESVTKRRIELAKGLFAKILELDPENFDVTQLKMELDSYVREEERKRVEAAQRKAELQRQRDDMAPGKNAYLKKEWFKAIKKLDAFLLKKNLEPIYITEASKMLNQSKDNLENQLKPIIGKARSLKEGQDLKGAYEQYKLVLRYDPSNIESLNQRAAILDELDAKSKRLYRAAIISESLTLFDEAKQKFQEVQQVSPTDSPYYKKATNKLKQYY